MKLAYSTDNRTGLVRRQHGNGFLYLTPKGKSISDEKTLVRIRSLVIPPAWTDVWISLLPHGHLQATGRDARGRKQYRYHPEWRELQEKSKFEKLIRFARVLPKIRGKVHRDLGKKGLVRDRIVATVVRLLDATLIRVGNDEYATQNHSFGLTTLHNRHVRIKAGSIQFSFRGKSGKKHDISLHDPRLAKIVKQCQELPGQELFEYVDDEGRRHDIGSQDVNGYLRQITGSLDFTAKDFRTWHGTVIATGQLIALEVPETITEAKREISRVIQITARALGNTPAVCRKAYIHPFIFEAYRHGFWKNLPTAKSTRGLHLDEQAVIRCLKASSKPLKKIQPLSR